MSTNRAALYGKLHKVVKKHYKPANAVDRSVLEHLLYACCLQNSRPDAADEAFAKLLLYADWNEVRVTTVTELAEMMSMISDPADAARRVKRTLQSVFETKYSFDLEYLKKMNLGKAVKELESFHGVTPFVAAYTSQHALGGHAIPTSAGTLAVLAALGAISENDAAHGRAPGLERAIPKTKGAEFACLLHQLGVDFQSARQSPKLRAILEEINPDVAQPKREKKLEPPAAAGGEPKTTSKARKSQRPPAAARGNPDTPDSTAKIVSDKADEPEESKSRKTAAKPLTKKKPR